MFDAFFSWYDRPNSLVCGCCTLQSVPNYPPCISEKVWLNRFKFRQEATMCCYCNQRIYTLCWPRSCSDSVVNTVWPETMAGNLVSAVARGRGTNSKDRQHRRWKQQKKTFNICCLKAVSLLPANESPFVVAGLDVSTGQNNITLQTGSPQQAKVEVWLFLRKSFSVLKGFSSVCNTETHFSPLSVSLKDVHFAQWSSLFSALSSTRPIPIDRHSV